MCVHAWIKPLAPMPQGRRVDEQVVEAFSLGMMHPAGRVGWGFHAVEVGYVAPRWARRDPSRGRNHAAPDDKCRAGGPSQPRRMQALIADVGITLPKLDPKVRQRWWCGHEDLPWVEDLARDYAASLGMQHPSPGCDTIESPAGSNPGGVRSAFGIL
jgi:hypothetical protein